MTNSFDNRREFLGKVAGGLASILATSTFNSSVRAGEEQEEVQLDVGKKLPNLEFPDTKGEKRKVLDALKGNLLLVEFWSSECGPCMKEVPNLNNALEHYRTGTFSNAEGKSLGKGLDIVSITLDDNKDKWLAAISKVKPKWEHHLFGNGWDTCDEKYGIRGIPWNFLLDQDGIILAKNLRAEKLEKKLKELSS